MYLSSRLPWPPFGGDGKSWQELELLQKEYDVTWLGIADPRKDAPAIAKLSQRVSRVVTLRDPLWKKGLRCLRLAWNGLPLQVEYYRSSAVAEKVRREAPGHDVIFCNLIRTVEWVRGIEKPLYLDMSDSIGRHYESARREISSPLWKLIYSFDGPRLRRYERRVVRMFRTVFLFNPRDVDELQFENRVKWIPHGVQPAVLEHRGEETFRPERICFLGKMDYRPNVEAVKWFCREVLPLLPEQYEFWILGTSPTAEVQALAREGRVRVTGFVEDPFVILKSSLCSVVPLFAGGGIQNKLLEAMGLGTVCLATPLAAEALVGAQPGRQFLLCEKPEEFARSIQELQPESVGYGRLRAEAREYILTNYTWDATGRALLRAMSRTE